MSAKGIDKPGLIMKSNSWPESRVQIGLKNKWELGRELILIELDNL